MSVFEELFESAILEVVVPDTSIEFPTQSDPDQWLARVQSEQVDRKQAFFDEQLQSLLLIRIAPPNASSSELTDPANPPPALLEFLSHLQISLEATYISPHAPAPPPPPSRPASTLQTPPRTDSAGRLKPQGRPNNPSIFPPPTPNPMPSTAEPDRKYVQAEGTLLISTIWGQRGASEDGEGEKLTLLWSAKEEVWIAVYQLSLTVAFLRLNTTEPLLCLTVSATLREKRIPIPPKQNKHPLLQFLKSHGDVAFSTPSSPLPPASPIGYTRPDDALTGLEEINLLAGLSAGPNFLSSRPGEDDEEESVHVPSTRLGDSVRRAAFALPSASIRAQQAHAHAHAPTTAHSTLRKSFRKTLRTVSGFRVRMRTVFVPYVLLNGKDQDNEQRGAGSEERTVVLCVEVENSGESGPGVGFAVEKVDVDVGGEGASATLIGIGLEEDGRSVFPVRLGSMEQYNLLYAVSFLQNPDDVDGFARPGEVGVARGASELQRAVAINIFGRPYMELEDADLLQHDKDEEGKRAEEEEEEEEEDEGEGEGADDSTKHPSILADRYPTHTFSSRWNCTLDLSPQAHRDPGPSAAVHPRHKQLKDALPEPASPFPMSQSQRSPHPATIATTQAQDQRMAGSKRYTVPVAVAASRGAAGSRMSLRDHVPPATAKPGSYTPPSISIQTHGSSSLTSPPITYLHEQSQNRASFDGLPPPPQTPAYPAYPRLSGSPVPQSHSPLSGQQSSVLGPSVEIRRDRASGSGLYSPAVIFAGAGGRDVAKEEENDGDSVVVSVGLLGALDGENDGDGDGDARIHPLDTFTLDIFIFNQSSWTRRFEVSYPDQRTRRKQEQAQAAGGRERHGQHSGGVAETPGILPLENRVRIGPLLPSTCQSVRMKFLAVTPGVHSIDTLTLTDIVNGYSINLRSVMDIVVHEPPQTS